jgi:hypothetical protein
MVRHDMATAFRAESPMAFRGLPVRAEERRALVTFTLSGFHRVKALIGAADQDRQEWQWQ